MPLDVDGYTMVLHDAEECPRPCDGFWQCAGAAVRLVQHVVTETEFSDVLDGLLRLGRELTGFPKATLDPLPAGPEGFRSYAVVTAPGDADNVSATTTQALTALRQTVNALRLATEGRFPRFTEERLWPMYLQTHLADPRANATVTIIALEDVNPYTTPPAATADQLDRTGHAILAASTADPVEVIRDFQLAARTALREGDYVQSVLSTSAACEVLLKHTAAMLIWEAGTVQNRTPAWLPDATYNPLAQKPSQLIGTILSQGLGGNWSSQTPTTPVGAWREHVARTRNRVIHRGYRPTYDEGHAAIESMDRVTTFVADRLGERARDFPRTAVCLVTHAGLRRRGAEKRVADILRDADAAGENWRADYQSWLETVDAQQDLDD